MKHGQCTIVHTDPKTKTAEHNYLYLEHNMESTGTKHAQYFSPSSALANLFGGLSWAEENN